MMMEFVHIAITFFKDLTNEGFRDVGARCSHIGNSVHLTNSENWIIVCM